MRKILSLFLVLLMIVSTVPLALADDSEDDTSDDYNSPREIAKERYDNARNNYAKAKEMFSSDMEKYRQAKEDFKEMKRKVKDACAEDKESQECKDAEKEAFEAARNTLLSAADQAYQHLAQIRSKIESSEDITDEEAAERISEIEGKMQELQNLIGKIGAADTKDELKEYAKDLQQIWAKFRNKAKRHVAKLINDKLSGVYRRSKQLGDKVECALSTVEESKKADIMAKVDEMNTLLDKAKTHHDTAKALLEASEESSTDKRRNHGIS